MIADCRALWSVAAGVCIAAGGIGFAHAQGTWQGTTYPPHANHQSTISNHRSQWLVLDTGGSGGGFGKGDIRQKLQDVHFWDNRVGWTCGYGGVFTTRDGGLSWTRMKPKGGWYHIEMSGPEDVWLLEGFHGQGKARLWHTTDDGGSWQEVAPDTFRGYTDLYCRGDQRWVLCGGYPSYRSDDGGTTWQRAHFPGGGLHQANRIAVPADVQTEAGLVIYVLGSHEQERRLVRSVDSGQSWSVVPLPADRRHYAYQLFFPTTWLGWVSDGDGRIHRTADGGETWTQCRLPTTQRVMSLWFDQLGRGFAAVGNTDFMHPRRTLYETFDAGASWAAVLGGKKHVSAIFGRGPSHIWAVGDVPGFIQNDLVLILYK